MTNRRLATGAVALSLVLPGLVARGQQRPARLGWLAGTNPRSSKARSARSEAVLVLASPRFFAGHESLAAEARRFKLPTVFGSKQHVEAGGLVSYGASLEAMFVRTANYVDKIIKGEAPANPPMEQPTEFDLAVNFKLAKEFGIKIPQVVPVRVTQRVE
jgi:putative tryptophan/tyrosine transport system substrate-binding protein